MSDFRLRFCHDREGTKKTTTRRKPSRDFGREAAHKFICVSPTCAPPTLRARQRLVLRGLQRAIGRVLVIDGVRGDVTLTETSKTDKIYVKGKREKCE